MFLLSLLSMPALYLFRWGTPAADASTAARDAGGNIALFTVFALHHSVMARTGAKRWITTLVPADLERSVYVWIASVLFLAACWFWRPLPGLAWHVQGPGLLLYVFALAGVLLTIAGARIVGIWELAGVTQPDPIRAIEFKAEGPFALVRHPIYLGWLLMVFPAPVMTSTRLLFAVISTIYLVVAIPLEERALVEAHGEKYESYQRAMRWKLVPGIW